MEELSKRIEEILKKFLQQELGNRLSEFSWIALKEMIVNEIRTYEPKIKEKKVDK